MDQNSGIRKLLSDLYNGHPWIDVTVTEHLLEISHLLAAKKLRSDVNSIWEITNHLIAWRENVLKRVNGEVIVSPEHNYFEQVVDQSEEAWAATLNKLDQSQNQWLSFLTTFDKKKFNTIYINNGMTYYEHVHGIIQHDAYHLGQITLLKRILRDWGS